MWTGQAQKEFAEMKRALLDDPCVKRFDSKKLVVIRTNFSSFGFGFVVLQPGDDAASVSAANDYKDGKGFTFMRKESKATLFPVCLVRERRVATSPACTHT
jgi:hypothetical protein